MSSARRGNRILALVIALVMTLASVALSGCAGATGSKDIALEPVVSNPAISTDGVLKVGIDTTSVPYAGVAADGEIVGIDVDVASLLAEEMGLKIEIVDTAGKDVDTLLNDQTIDMVMDVEKTGGSVMQGLQVGPYIEGGPALFTVVEASDSLPAIELKSLSGTKIAAQKDSLSAWSVDELIEKGTSDQRESLEDAFAAVENGEVTYAAADAVVGSYLAADKFQDVSCVKMLGTSIGVYIGVSQDNTQLADALTVALRNLRDYGQLKTILSKWLGPISAEVVMGTSAVTTQKTSQGTSNSGAAAVPDETVPNEEVLDTGEDLPDPANAGGL